MPESVVVTGTLGGSLMEATLIPATAGETRLPDRLIRPADPSGGGLVAQVGEHSEDAPMVARRRGDLQLVEDARHVLLDGGLADHERLRDPLVRLALGHRGEDVALARAQALERAGRPAATEHAPHDLRIERGAARSDAPDGVDEGVDVADPLLEQIADTLGPL